MYIIKEEDMKYKNTNGLEVYMNDPKKTMEMLIDLPNHKLKYVLHAKTLVEGLWGNLAAYGIKHTKENHDLLVELVQTKLVGSEDIEYEWSEEEYENFVAR
jgi:hypothetical protein